MTETTIEEETQLKQKEPGFWHTHKYRRLNVKDYIDEFCGWSALKELISYAGDLRNSAFFASLFETGGRVGEVLPLVKENFIVSPDRGIIIVRDMSLEKRYKKLEEILSPDGKTRWKTQKLHTRRKDFPIVIAEPLTSILIEYLDTVKEGLLFPSPYMDNDPLSRSWAYKEVRRIDKLLPSDLKERLGLNKCFLVDGQKTSEPIHLWLHWFRSQRASQLVRDYGFEVIDLLKFFSWEDYETAITYAQKGVRDLAAKMQTFKVVYT